MGVTKLETMDEYKQKIGGAKPVAIDFTATWCGPCKMIGPFFEELSVKYTNIDFCKVDVDENDQAAADAGISAMPTFKIFKNGTKVDELVGADKGKLEDMLKKYN